jgi:hypothetical protein
MDASQIEVATRLTAVVLLLGLLSACATPRMVRLETGQGAPLESAVAVSAEGTITIALAPTAVAADRAEHVARHGNHALRRQWRPPGARRR